MKLTDYSHKTLLRHSRELDDGDDSPGVAELEALRNLLERTAETPPLPELNQERILAAARAARRRTPWQGLAAAAAIALIFSISAFRKPPPTPAPALASEDTHPLAMDFLLTELDLLDLQLLELQETAWFDTAATHLEDSI